MRLAARLFYEHLLDQDCYLDWYLSSMESSPLAAFPIWLAMLNIYWGSLVRFRKRGRRLAEALLEKLREATFSDFKLQLQPLIDRISLFVRRLCRENSPCLILPRSWDRYQDVVTSSLSSGDSKEKATLQSLILRNARVQRPGPFFPVRQRSPQEQVIKLLDASRDTCDMCALSSSCLALLPDRQDLVSVLLTWAASPFRQGLVRVYIAVRLFRKWKRSGMDIDACIFPFLTQTSIEHSTSSMANVYHIIVELIRSQTFSVGRYLQWLVARGAVEQYRQQNSALSAPVDIALLSHIPVARLPRHLRNLRDTLMARAGLSSFENEVLHSIKAHLKQRLPGLFGKDDSHVSLDYDQNNLSWSIKADISQWIRAAVSEHYEHGSAYHPKMYESSVEVSSLTQEEFLVVRSILEQYGDLSMLADILIDASNSDDVRLLTCAVDTLNRHFECFTIIGALGDMFRSFYEAFLRVKNNGQPLYDLAYSMAEVGHRLPNEVNSLTLLRQELSRADRNLALAVCSPVSDMAETLNDASPSFNEDMDHFLSSGNSMDEMTMILVFQKLIQQLAFYNEKDASMPGTVCRHLVQLRSFNSKHFDLLLVQWLETTLKSTSRPRLSQLLHPLVGIGCVTLPAFATLMMKILQSGSLQTDTLALPDLLVDFLDLLVPNYSGEPLHDFLSYRFRIAQEEFLHGHSHEVLTLLKDSVSHISLNTAQDIGSFAPCVVPLLSEIIVRHPEDTTLDSIRGLLKTYPLFLPVVHKSLDVLLNDDQENNSDFLMQTAATITKTNHLSLPLCQMKLQILFNEKNDDAIRNSIVDLMYKSAVADVRAGHTYWLDLVSTMGQEAAEQVCNC